MGGLGICPSEGASQGCLEGSYRMNRIERRQGSTTEGCGEKWSGRVDLNHTDRKKGDE